MKFFGQLLPHSDGCQHLLIKSLLTFVRLDHFMSSSIRIKGRYLPVHNMAPRRVSMTNLEKREVIEWIEGHGDGVYTRAVKRFQAERG